MTQTRIIHRRIHLQRVATKEQKTIACKTSNTTQSQEFQSQNGRYQPDHAWPVITRSMTVA